MNLQRVIVLSAVVAVGATLTVEARQGAMSSAPIKSQGGAPAGVLTPRPAAPTFARAVEARIVKGAPYSAEIVNESVQQLADGNRIVQRSTGRVYRDGEGRIRREDDRASGIPTISITDPVAKTTTTLDVTNRIAHETAGVNVIVELSAALNTLTASLRERPSTTGDGAGGVITAAPARAGRIAGSSDPQSQRSSGGGGRGGAVAPAPVGGGGARGGAVGAAAMTPRAARGEDRVDETLPSRQIEGVMCTGIRRTTTIAKGAIGNDLPIKIVSEEWTSTDLQVLVLTDVNDPRSGRTTYQLQRIARVEPEASLFKAPSDYTIQKATAGGRGRGGSQ